MKPIVSVVMANYNGDRHLAEALRSILHQSLTELEVILVDDASSDRSIAIAETMAAEDPRLQIQRLDSNVGPAAARNRGLEAAGGAWIAIVDSDDFIHPDRLRRLVAAAETDNADLIADDLLIFTDDHRVPPRRLLNGALAAAPSWIMPEQYVRSNRLIAPARPLGYLKPLIRASLLTEHNVRYTEGLRIAEDYDLIARLLVRGARFRLLPELLYFYRQHSGSISHRLSPETLQAMVVADSQFRSWAGDTATAPLRVALDVRLASIHIAGAAEETIANLKARRILATLSTLIRQPGLFPVLARLLAPSALVARMRRRRPPRIPATLPRRPRPTICVLSRQRLTAGTSGSSTYLLSLCRTLRENGFALNLICPSPKVLGRMPVLRVAAAGDVFDHVAIRGTYRIGGLFVTGNPLIFLQAAIAVADRLARRMGIIALGPLARRAPYAVGLPWTAEDYLFVAAQARGQADIVLADYGFLTPGIPYALCPGASSAVVMHDLFSGRPAAFSSVGSRDSVAVLDKGTEADLLAGADLVIAIQIEEAAAVKRMLPHGPPVLVAPMAIEPVAAAQAGEGGGLLFVGSGTQANVDGMHWFLTDIWPHIRARLPDTQLRVAGAVCTKLDAYGRRAGVVLLGCVTDLAPLYRRADVVISPLRAGSGLKIKLVEALAHGKPIVATTVTVQGVTHLLDGVLALADTSEDFATQVINLLIDPALRRMRAESALAAARRHFSTRAAYGKVVEHFQALRAGGTMLAPAAMVSCTNSLDTAVTQPFVSIVVPTLNEERHIESCLKSLIGQWPEGAYEILVADGGSTDSTLEIVASIRKRHGAVALLHNPLRLQSAAMNLAARVAAPQATVLVRADAHAHYSPDFVRSCVSALLRTGATSVVVPMHTRARPGAFQQAGIAAAQSSRLGNGGSAHRNGTGSGFVDHGHHAAFDRKFFRSIGGYDENFSHNEDAELDVRAIDAGGGVWMCAEAPVTYYPRDRLDSLARQYFRHGGGRARTLRKHNLRPRPRQLIPVILLSGCLAGLAAAPFLPTLASLTLLYPAACLGWGAVQAIRQRDPRLIAGGPALMTMHLSWGTGFLIGALRPWPRAIPSTQSANAGI